MNPALTLLSLGWGVQSFTLAAMSALGELPRLDAALNSDTTHESSETYAFAERWTPWLKAHGVRVVVVSNPTRTAKVSSSETDIPAFAVTPNRREKWRGQLLRQCTESWKIRPMRVWITEKLKQLNVKKSGGVVAQWLGISLDEVERMKPSDVRYIESVFPLIDLRMTRQDCVTWLQARGLEVPPKSACVFCPYHSAQGWVDLAHRPEDFARAVAVDEAIRKARPPRDLFVHPACKPLVQIDLRTPEEQGQLDLFAREECAGVCFV